MQSSTVPYPQSQSRPVTEPQALPLLMGVMSALQSISVLQFELHQKELFMEHNQGQVKEWHKLSGFNIPLKFLIVASHINILSFNLGNCGAGERGIKLAGLIFFQFLENSCPRE